ncbi:hypothetical protein D6T65_15110 [Arthrobacter frigidicola]|nr:hypothetical protein D6T65_15110 [Arthrobacter frigidicola]
MSIPRFRPVTPLDVLREYFGDLPTAPELDVLSYRQIEEIGALLTESARASIGDAVPAGTYYPGGWLAGNWNHREFGPELTASLLYYPRLLLHDPLAAFFFNDFDSLPATRELRMEGNRPGSQSGSMQSGPQLFARHGGYSRGLNNEDHSREWFKQIVLNVTRLAPLIDKQILILRDQWPVVISRKESLESSVRHDVRATQMLEAASAGGSMDPPTARWDNIRGLNVMPVGMHIRAADKPFVHQDEFLYLAKSLAIADDAQATYAPPTDADFSLLRAKLALAVTKQSRVERHPSEVLTEVSRLLIPDLELDLNTTVKVRKDEDSFDDWRRSLSALARDAKDDDPATLAARVEDALIPRIHDINKATSKSSTLRQHMIVDGSSIAVSATLGAVFAGPPGAAAGAAIGAAPGVIGWLMKAYQPSTLSGRDTVLARIVRGTRGS